MRWVWVLAIGCGRIGFAPLTPGGGDDGASDGSIGDGGPTGTAANLVAFHDQTCATFRGAAYCWGFNAAGQLGDGSTTDDHHAPTPVALPAGTVDALAIGENHGCASIDGSASCWGSGAPAPAAVSFPGTVTALSAGRDFTCGIATAKAYCWGNNDIGQLGIGTEAPQPAPAEVQLVAPQLAIDAGDDHACALSTLDAATCWGHNDDGAIGEPINMANSDFPVNVVGVSTLPHIAGWHACAIVNGRVKCWGRGDHGMLGDGQNMDSSSPVDVGLTNVTAIGTGGNATELDASCAVSAGDVYCWGSGVFGRLGQGSATDASTPTQVVGLPGPATSVALGYDHSCALLVDGDVWCWGHNNSGQLGDGTTTDRLQPVRVSVP